MAEVRAMYYLSGVNRPRMWTTAVTPLASIIGDKLLVVGPLLYQNIGSYHVGAIVRSNALAHAVGRVVRNG